MKNKIFLLAFTLLILVTGRGQQPITVFYNYIKSTEYLTGNEESGAKIGNIVYSNNFGAPTEIINIAGTPNQKDIAVKVIYGKYGRQVKNLLPVPTGQSGGEIIEEEDFQTLYTNYYQTNYNEPEYFYSEVELEAPPLNRPLKKSAPGQDWALGSGNEVEYKYEIAPTADAVVNYKAVATWNATNKIYNISLQKVGNYGAGLLHKTTQTDENGHKVEQFVNRKGQTVLIRKFSTTGTGTTPVKHDTYYVYDSYGNLTYMLPPLLSNLSSITATNLNELGYQYKYDSKNRLVEKQLPGKGLETFVYDKQDRLVATRDAMNPWMFVKYDKFGREVYSGTYSGSESRVQLQNLVDGLGSNNEDRSTTAFTQDGISVYYTKTAFPASSFSLFTVNYYDNYTNIMATGVSVPASVEGQTVLTAANSLNGVQTASFTRVLGTNKWEQVYTFYDNKLRPVRTYKLNHLGGYTYVDSKLDFRGKPEYTKTYHKRLSTNLELMVQDNFTYDHQERLLNTTNKIGSGNTERISYNTFDALGNLSSKQVGNTTTLAALQKVDYKYNIRGWMTGINDIQALTQSGAPIDLFSFNIKYNDPVSTHFSSSDVIPLYNGNISETLWRTASDNILRGYGYEYDEFNRLKSALYQKPGTTVPLPGNFDENLTYDLNGNIMSVNRFASKKDQVSETALTDDLVYTYTANSNKLLKITDATNSGIGFSNGTSGTANDYTYDANGNMLTDNNKGITSISYNHLNQPVQVFWTATKKIDYQYNAAGQKVQKTVTNGSTVTTTDYLDGFQYNNTFLEFFPHAEGYVKVTIGALNPNNPQYAFNYVYNYTDHLGNVRLSYTKDPSTSNLKILDEAHYYPFGLKHLEYNVAGFVWAPSGVIVAPIANNPFKYKFQSQELQDEHGLNWYSYRYRNYDPATGRFFNVDPLSESFAYNGVYNFSENRVVDAFELEGLESVEVNGKFRDMNSDELDYYHSMPSGEYGDLNNDGKADALELPGGTITGSISSGRVENVHVPYRDNIVIPDNVDLGIIGDAINMSNGFKNGQQDFVVNTVNSAIDLYNDGGKKEYWEDLATETVMSAYSNPMLNNDPQLKMNMAMSVYNASAYDWGYFGGYQGTAFAASYVTTAGVGGLFGSTLKGIGNIEIPVYRRFGGGISRASGDYWSMINPRLYGKSYRNFAGLPDWNTAAFQIKGEVSLKDIFNHGKIRPAAPFHGNFGRLVPELKINASKVNITHYNGFPID